MEYNNSIIENILREYEYTIGKDFEKYRNHVYRVFNTCLILDDSKQNDAKYAVASAFHDLGIWTNRTLDYLKPSIALAHKYLEQINNQSWNDEIKLIIDMHHKRSKYVGPYQQTVEIFRKADWIDVTQGRKSFGIDKNDYKNLVKIYPYLGLHRFLLFQTFKNFIKSPFNPLPMFKK